MSFKFTYWNANRSRKRAERKISCCNRKPPYTRLRWCKQTRGTVIPKGCISPIPKVVEWHRKVVLHRFSELFRLNVQNNFEGAFIRNFVCKLEVLLASKKHRISSIYVRNENIMKRNLRLSLGIFTLLLVGIISANDVSAQTIYSPSTQWYSSPQTFSSGFGVQTQYSPTIQSSPVYSQSYNNWYPSQPQAPWAAQSAPSNNGYALAQPQPIQSNVYAPSAAAAVNNLPAAYSSPNTANVMSCQGGT